jgi:hypothetical protein
MTNFDTVARRLLERVQRGRQQITAASSHGGNEANPAFEAALPLLYKNFSAWKNPHDRSSRALATLATGPGRR